MNRSFPAQILAETTAPYFAEHAESARRDGEYNIAIPPTAEMIEEITDAAFWASLRREEGYTPRISLAYASPDGGRAIRFDRPLALSSTALTKVAPAVERPGVHLGVWLSNGELCVWGTTRDLPSLCFVLEVIAPGLLIVKHSRAGGSTKYVNVAVLEGDQMKMLGESAAGLVDCPGVHASLLGFSAPGPDEFTSVLVQIAVSMRDHGRGGLLLVVNAGDDWRQSILQPIPYAVTPPFSELAELTADHREDDRTWQDALHRSVAMVGGLTAVDGATILNHKQHVLAFGAKVARRRDARVDQLIVTEPVIGSQPEVLSPSQFGGTRHLAAAQFVHDQRDAIAMVASQDGRFTVFAWSPCDNMVRAHRVESLLLQRPPCLESNQHWVTSDAIVGQGIIAILGTAKLSPARLTISDLQHSLPVPANVTSAMSSDWLFRPPTLLEAILGGQQPPG